MQYVCKGPGGCKLKSALVGTAAGSGGGGVAVSAGLPIQGSVGANGRNLDPDVRVVQKAVNNTPPASGGANPQLTVDGLCGNKTKQAIQIFQIKHFGWSQADSRVDVGMQTSKKLAQTSGILAAKSAATAGTGSKVALNPTQFIISITLAKKWLEAAQGNLLVARQNLLNPVVSNNPMAAALRAKSLQLLNRHFSIETWGKQAVTKVDFLQERIRRMLKLYEWSPGPMGNNVFDLDQTGDKEAFAYTWWGGYFKNGQFRFEKNNIKVRLDAIYVCDLFVPLSVENAAFVHVHEMAHFIGSPEFIHDHAYNHTQGGQAMAKLSVPLRLLNAESYANYVFQCGMGANAPLPAI